MAALLAASPVVDAPFRRVCRMLGATVCVTEFIGVEQILSDSRLARRRATLADDDQPTAIQIYGGDPDLLLAAARLVTPRSGPAGSAVPARLGRTPDDAGWVPPPVSRPRAEAKSR